jgi:lipoprotein-anchoring transpeptidase ErfK/SrfK
VTHAASAASAVIGCLAVLLASAGVRADAPFPPWSEAGEVPLASWARSVAPKPGEHGQRGEMVLFAGPNRASDRRGVSAPGATLPLFGARRGAGCTGGWWLVGPLAWTCSDTAVLAAEEPGAPSLAVGPEGLPHAYFFVGADGASAYPDLESAEEGTSDRELDPGWSVAVVEQRVAPGQRWARTTKGLWLAQGELVAARPSAFHGEHVDNGTLDVAWVVADRASVWPSADPSSRAKPKGVRVRFERVRVLEEAGASVRIGADEWMRLRDLARPATAVPPSEVGRAGERWIDVDLATQTLVAYEGTRPVYATLVSTGRGPKGTDSATPPGVHRIWVKIFTSDMASADPDDPDANYSLQEVPYVQFFDRAVALHGTYWHHDFGRVHSHGCVNLAPIDAHWLFDFTAPRLPPGWAAAYPTTTDEGTLVRVR